MRPTGAIRRAAVLCLGLCLDAGAAPAPAPAPAAPAPVSCSDLGIPVIVGKEVYRTKYTITTLAPGPHTPAHAVTDPGTTVSALVVGTLLDGGTVFWNSSSPPTGPPAHPGWFTYQYVPPLAVLTRTRSAPFPHVCRACRVLTRHRCVTVINVGHAGTRCPRPGSSSGSTSAATACTCVAHSQKSAHGQHTVSTRSAHGMFVCRAHPTPRHPPPHVPPREMPWPRTTARRASATPAVCDR